MTEPHPSGRLVQVRTGASIPVLIGLVVSVALIVAIVASGAMPDGVSTTGGRVALAVAAAVGAVGLAVIWLARPRSGATWDLDQRTVTAGSRTIPFASIRRVIVCTGAKGYYGLLFFTEEERLARLSIPVRSRRHPAPEVWHAVRELLASPHEPTLDGYGTPKVSADEFLTNPPLAATRGTRAIAILDAQIAWVANGGNPRARNAPLERFRHSRHSGP